MARLDTRLLDHISLNGGQALICLIPPPEFLIRPARRVLVARLRKRALDISKCSAVRGSRSAFAVFASSATTRWHVHTRRRCTHFGGGFLPVHECEHEHQVRRARGGNVHGLCAVRARVLAVRARWHNGARGHAHTAAYAARPEWMSG